MKPLAFLRRREMLSVDVPVDDLDPVVTLRLSGPPVLQRVAVTPPPIPVHKLTSLSAAKRGIPLRTLQLPDDDMRDLAEKLEGLARQAAAWESLTETRDLYVRVAAAARASLPEGP